LRDQEHVPLNPKAFDILLTLVESSGHIVEKDDRMKRVWPNTFVEEGNLTQNVSLLRKALGESASGPQFIETVPRRGYRFVATVNQVSQGSFEAAPIASESDGEVEIESDVIPEVLVPTNGDHAQETRSFLTTTRKRV